MDVRREPQRDRAGFLFAGLCAASVARDQVGTGRVEIPVTDTATAKPRVGRVNLKDAAGKPRVAERLPAPLGNGYWTQEIYYHLLDCGLRTPPSAGSASGVLPNPVGYNRVYVHVGKELTWEKWWEGLRAGRSFVSNGPLLRVKADGELPGHVFTATEGQGVKVEIKAELTTRDKIRFLEVIKNGEVE
ncbi:MAG TPA: hypothetical protein VMZ71_16810, partial [Gemmataceae bacterium]|nr:hypothetical protein [Gemmataceae bacterium]